MRPWLLHLVRGEDRDPVAELHEAKVRAMGCRYERKFVLAIAATRAARGRTNLQSTGAPNVAAPRSMITVPSVRRTTNVA